MATIGELPNFRGCMYIYIHVYIYIYIYVGPIGQHDCDRDTVLYIPRWKDTIRPLLSREQLAKTIPLIPRGSMYPIIRSPLRGIYRGI